MHSFLLCGSDQSIVCKEFVLLTDVATIFRFVHSRGRGERSFFVFWDYTTILVYTGKEILKKSEQKLYSFDTSRILYVTIDSMQEERENRINVLQEKIAAFETSMQDHIAMDPEKAWIYLARAVHQIRSSDDEMKFVTLAAITNLIAAMFQLGVGLRMKSISVVSAAVDSILDFALWMFNLFLLGQSKKEQDSDYNYGYGKLQWFGALFQGIIILVFGISLIYFSIQKLLHATPVQGLWLLMVVMLLDFVGGLCSVAFYFLRVKHSENMIVIGTLKKIYAWLLFNIGIMSGLILIYIGLHYFDAERYFIDPSIGLIVACYVLFTAGQLLRDGYGMLMDKSLPDEEVDEIKHIIHAYRDQYVRRDGLATRVSWTAKYIECNVYFDARQKSFSEIYTTCLVIKEELESTIAKSVVKITPLPE